VKHAAIAILVASTLCARADQVFPGPEWKDGPHPLASPDAVVGGEISVFAGQYSKSFNYYLDNNMFTLQVFSSLYETLLENDPLTAEYVPGVAEKWSISDDKLTFTFWIDEHAKWSDGKPITAEDVRWTFDAILNPANLTGIHKVALEKFHPPEVVSERVIRFKAKEVHWRNLGAAGGMHILPSHVMRDLDFNKINFEFPVVSGPARIGEIKEGIFVKMKRRDDWWGWTRAANRNLFNFETITFRFYAERENAFEVFKKGKIDIYPIYTSRLWINETKGEKFEKNWIVKQKVQNYQPQGFQGFVMNMRRPPFDDVRVRKAMAHLLDRERMNRTLMYSQYYMHRSYWEDLYDRSTPCENPYFEFNPDKARALLKDAGWSPNPKTGILEKDGKPFAFKFLTRSATSEKFLAIFTEDLKDVGIELTIDKKDWATWAKDMDTFNFAMTWAAWGASIFKDPEGMWASKEAERKSGNNYAGFSSPRVDTLIEKQKTLFDVGERHAICREIDGILAAQCPYALLWNINYVRLLYWNKFGMPDTVLTKYGDERSAYALWWHDEDSAADLEDAMENGEHVPGRPPEVVFDETFRPVNTPPPSAP